MAPARTPRSPPRVRLRLFEAAGGKCAACTRKIRPGDSWQADHVAALANGGENRERNLQILCGWCHADKTRADVAEKSRTYRKKLKAAGAKPKGRGFWKPEGAKYDWSSGRYTRT